MELFSYLNEMAIISVALFMTGVHTLYAAYRHPSATVTGKTVVVQYVGYLGVAGGLMVWVTILQLAGIPIWLGTGVLLVLIVSLVGIRPISNQRFGLDAGWFMMVVISMVCLLVYWPW